MPFVACHNDGRVLLRLYVQPKASRTRLFGFHGNAVKVAVTAPPVDGKANDAVLSFLATFLGVKKRDLEISHGLQSRNKAVLVTGVAIEEIREKIGGSLT